MMTMINYPSTVDVVIPTDSVQTVVMLLISNNISFTLTCSKPPETLLSLQTMDSSNEALEDPEPDRSYALLNPANPKEAVIRSIYLKYLKQNIERLPPDEVQIAAEFGINTRAFKNGFKSVYGKTFYQLYMGKKMDYAKKLLMQGKSATEVSQEMGYSQPIKFNKIFQKYVGMTPKKYQRSYIEKLGLRGRNSQPKING